MDIVIDVKETTQSFNRSVNFAICDLFNSQLPKAVTGIKNGIAPKIKSIFENTKEYTLLVSDAKVKADIGLPHGKERDILDKIFQRIVDSIEVTYVKLFPTLSGISGGFSIDILLADFSDILSLPEAKIISQHGTNNWLEWILKEGSSILVQGYHIEYGKFGRSGQGHMVLSGAWTVDSRLQGTENDNWLTKTLIKNKTVIENMIADVAEKEIEKVL